MTTKTSSANIRAGSLTRPLSAFTSGSEPKVKPVRSRTKLLIRGNSGPISSKKKVFFNDEVVINGVIFDVCISEQLKHQLIKVTATND